MTSKTHIDIIVMTEHACNIETPENETILFLEKPSEHNHAHLSTVIEDITEEQSEGTTTFLCSETDQNTFPEISLTDTILIEKNNEKYKITIKSENNKTKYSEPLKKIEKEELKKQTETKYRAESFIMKNGSIQPIITIKVEEPGEN